MLLTQVELEQKMIASGIARTRAAFADAEVKGHADQNPYASEIYRLFVEPLAQLIDEAKASKGPAKLQAHVALLAPLDSWGIAYIAVRVALTTVMAGVGKDHTTSSRTLGKHLGKMIHTELYLSQFQEISPDLFFILSEDLARKKSKDVEYRLSLFKQQAKANGLDIVEWGQFGREQVGLWLLDQLLRLEMLVMDAPPPGAGKRGPLGVYLSDYVASAVQKIGEFFELTRPTYGPCVEPPRDWESWDNGGFHTSGMRRALPYCVRAPQACRARLKDHPIPKVLKCLNALQRTPWQINGELLDWVQRVASVMDTKELISEREESKPPAPSWLGELGSKDERTPEQEAELTEWKRKAKEWHTMRKLQRSAKGRMLTTLATSREYRDYPAMYFVYFADSRGRVYPLSNGVSPQGSDMQKALIRFANGKPLSNGVSVAWFYIHGANKFGFDKAPLLDRARWYQDKEDLILACAADPVNNTMWLEADKPLQFLAWALEFAKFRADPDNFVSHIPVGLDGSCSGLQHFSAMLRDDIGGRATNLTDNDAMEDIYRTVAEAATRRMMEAAPDAEGYRDKWLSQGITRSVTKRSVMTTPYGVTKRSAVKYVIEDYLKGNKAFNSKDHYGQAHYLMNYVWPAIGDVVVKGREAMSWLTASAKSIVKAHTEEDEGVVSWVTPSGFLATQAYYEEEEHRISTKLFGHARIKVLTDTDESSVSRHATAMAPNFVHSMDASHLHLTVGALVDTIPDVSLAFIHDDFGVHADDAQALFNTLREEFVNMYEGHDPLNMFMNRYPTTTSPPSKGNLNLEEVLRSDFFFS